MKRNTLVKKHLVIFLISRYQKSTEKGYILVLVLGLVLAINALLMAYAVLTKVERITMRDSSDLNSGFYGAEAGLNLRAEKLRQTFVDYNQPSGISPSSISACADSDSTNDGTGDYACRNYQFASASSNRASHIASTYVVERNGGIPKSGVVPRGEAYQNLNMLEYSYSVYSVAKKEHALSSEVTAILQLDVKSRLIPMFQFAAFYANDLEILPGPTMNLSGPVHTNGDLYLGANNNNGLNINSQVTLSGDLYNKRKNNNSTYPDGRVRIIDAAGTTFLNLLSNGTGSTNRTTNPMDPVLIGTAWGTQVQLGLESISLPPPSLLQNTGEYYRKADLRILYRPFPTSNAAPTLSIVPFEVTAIDRSSGTSVNIKYGELRSLGQPILVTRELASTTIPENFRACSPSTPPTSPITSLTPTQQIQLPQLLYTAILAQPKPIPYSSLSEPLEDSDDLSEVRTYLVRLINSTFSESFSSVPLDIRELSPAQIAALDNRCFVSAPLQDIGRDDPSHNSLHRFYNDRERREMRLLQLNFQSLTIWNKVGRYVKFDNQVMVAHNAGQGFSTQHRLFPTAPPNADAPSGSFQNLGLAGNDSSEGGLVIHATIDSNDYPNAGGNTSPYGFAITKGRQLMSLAKNPTHSNAFGVTFATDQAVYVQGDYNNSLNKQPAAILADSLNVLSNACLNANEAINKRPNKNCDIDGSKTNAVNTTINAAFLAGTDITNSSLTSGYNGGLENYPRFSENWSGRTLTYRGSFVSLGTPFHVRGRWGRQRYNAPNRNWDYDTDFNNGDNLPPLTPRFVYLRQESFIRNFQQ